MWICGRVRDERSMVVGDQGALGSGADLPVEPDGSVEGEQALEDTGPQPRGDAAAMAVQAELVLQRPDDRLHPLAQPGGEAAWIGFVGAGGRLAGSCSSRNRAWRSPTSLGLARPNPVVVPSQVTTSSRLAPQ